MMREDDKPFVLYRKGPMNFTIVPRGVTGWAQFAAWMALLAPPTITFAIYAEAHKSSPELWIGLALYLAVTLIWTLAGIAWMKARAEVVDIQKLLRLKREMDRKRR
jgi:TRAP-type C4-dicarboxylate transport system permease large subunit